MRIAIASLLLVAALGCEAAPPVDPENAFVVTPWPREKPGFEVHEVDGRLWVLRPGQQRSAEHVSLVGAGPDGMTIKALDRDTALAYVAARPGFVTEVENGRLWVLREGQRRTDRHIVLIAAGPQRMTMRAPDRATALEYLGSAPGFEVEVHDGNLWVFRAGQPHETPIQHVTVVGAGPMRVSVKAAERNTLHAYLEVRRDRRGG